MEDYKLTPNIDNTMTETLPAASPTYISVLLLFQQRQVICSYICSIDIAIS